MSKKLMAILALNNAILGGGLLYVYDIVLNNSRIMGVLYNGFSNTSTMVYQNQLYIQQIVAFLSR